MKAVSSIQFSIHIWLAWIQQIIAFSNFLSQFILLIDWLTWINIWFGQLDSTLKWIKWCMQLEMAKQEQRSDWTRYWQKWVRLSRAKLCWKGINRVNFILRSTTGRKGISISYSWISSISVITSELISSPFLLPNICWPTIELHSICTGNIVTLIAASCQEQKGAPGCVLELPRGKRNHVYVCAHWVCVGL